jgi:hypothetical protein
MIGHHWHMYGMKQNASKANEGDTLKEQKMKNKNESAIRCALQLSLKDQVINALPSNWLWFCLYFTLTSPFSAVAFYSLAIGDWFGLVILGAILAGGFIPGWLMWNLVVQLPIYKTKWWKKANEKVMAYKTILPYLQICPIGNNIGSFALHTDNILKAIAMSSKRYQHDEREFLFEQEFRRLHRAMRLAHLAWSHDWNDYRS